VQKRSEQAEAENEIGGAKNKISHMAFMLFFAGSLRPCARLWCL
jgi:hypothetical protein